MEKGNNQLVPISNSLININRQIAIGEKLLGVTLSEFEKNKIKKLLIRVVSENYNILSIICRYLLLSENIIEQYKDKLEWSSLCSNEKIGWDENFIDKYQNYIDWEAISSNCSIKWDENLIDKYFNHINLDLIIEYKTLDLNYTMYLKYKDKISLDTLNYIKINLPKEFVKKNKEILEWDNFFPWTFENFEYFEHVVDWKATSRNTYIDLDEKIIEKYKNFWRWDKLIKVLNIHNEIIYFRIFYTFYSDVTCTNLVFKNDSLIDDIALSQLKDSDVWTHLSRDLKIVDEFILEKYANYWDWDLISNNNSISWSFELVEKFKDKINWKVFSLNPNVIWNDLFIKKFENYINWDLIGLNTNLPWSIDFYMIYKNKINPQFLFFIEKCETINDEFLRSNRVIGECFVDNHFNVNLDKNNFDFKLIEHFKESLDWDMISRQYSFEKKDIKQFKNYISWNNLSWNRQINWDKELLETYIDNWNWEFIFKNKLINFEMFNYKLLSKSIDFVKENDLFQAGNPGIGIWFRNYFTSIINYDDVEMILDEI